MRSFGAGHAWRGCAAALLLLIWPGPGPGAAQSPSPDRPPAAIPSRSPLPPLQTEPGDIWAEVRSWHTGPQRRGLSGRTPDATGAAHPGEGAPARGRSGRKPPRE